MNASEVYQDLADFIATYLTTDTQFSKMLYEYMLLDDEISGKDLCIILYGGVLSKEDGMYESFLEGDITTVDFMKQKIQNLEITRHSWLWTPVRVLS